ncbi:sigma factor-binding protein Crl [Vibrio sp. Hep-1b-8]|uniref:sigma factor-binding protein Crl n=1 Tax=Vibrio sp. Hep-1b-8 TaxID=2144187 RepID=UPI001110AF77|nr:sigma factor-binding protein Crl [Vibrio sp. Hep-1b-8]TMX31961.1 sigma factor-binding protein Crl [Vibrio sp. Hep-1b-8]
MSEPTKSPTHYRLLSTLRAIGPYLRESQSTDGMYIFDCLSVCVNDKKSPEQREFWGWWLELEKNGDLFEARYRTGLYDVAGEWKEKALPKKTVEDVTRTQEAFHQKLIETLGKEFEIPVAMHKESVEFV